MHNVRPTIQFSPLSVCFGVVGVLFVVYVGLIAVVISYAALTVEFSQSVKNDEAAVAVLEGEYLAGVSRVVGVNYAEDGYTKPIVQAFVRTTNVTALR